MPNACNKTSSALDAATTLHALLFQLALWRLGRAGSQVLAESKQHNTIPPVRGNPFIGPHRARLLGRATDAAGSRHTHAAAAAAAGRGLCHARPTSSGGTRVQPTGGARCGIGHLTE
jgi:hypothetical protein